MKHLVFTAALLLTACGHDDSSESTPVAPNDASALDTARGDKGEKGDAGKDGSDGEKGEKGDRGDKGDTTSANEWYDQIAERYWIIGPTADFRDDACGNGYHMPSVEEAQQAWLHGFFVNPVAPIGVWTDVAVDSNGKRTFVDSAGYAGVTTPSTDKGLACIEDKE